MDIIQALKDKLGCQWVDDSLDWSSSGLNQTAVIQTDRGRYFIKYRPNQTSAMYAAESSGLRAILNTGTVKAPAPFYFDQEGGGAYLIMEYLSLSSHTPKSQSELGESLARMHLSKGAQQFGFGKDNTIGLTPQVNCWSDDWVQFFLEYRLEYQLKLIEARYQDCELRREAEPLLRRLPSFFKGIEVAPSLLHGDLWIGNTGKISSGEAVIYDPAVYYGHHEAEFGIIAMFGGFSSEFYEAYEHLIPRKKGFDERVEAYRLYHALNHYTLFGDSYRGSCLSICRRYR